MRLRALEGSTVIETDADATRDRYLAALAEITDEWSRKLSQHGGHLLRAPNHDDPADVVRRTVSAISGRFLPRRDTP